MTQRFRNFCFTSYDIDEFMFRIKYFKKELAYLIFQIEECPKTGNYHIQGYAECSDKLHMSSIHKLVNHKMHIENRLGTQQQAISYCKKDDTYVKPHRYEYGEPKEQGKRTDLQRDADIILNGGTLQDISPSNIIKYSKGFEKLVNMQLKPRDWMKPPQVIWIYGESGSGKTTYIYSKHTDIYMKESTNKWWDGYKQQEVILIDDFRHWELGFDNLLRLLQSFPYQGETKGSTVEINSPFIYITSVLKPNEVLNSGHQKDTITQLLRRITKIIHLEKK